MNKYIITILFLLTTPVALANIRIVTGYERDVFVHDGGLIRFAFIEVANEHEPVPNYMVGELIEELFYPPGSGAWMALCLFWGNGYKAMSSTSMYNISHANGHAMNQLYYWPNYDLM